MVIIPWLKALSHAEAEYFYTGITRAKLRVYIVGEWKAVCQAIHTDDTGTRKTMLAAKYNSIVNGISHRVIDRSRQQFATGLCKK